MRRLFVAPTQLTAGTVVLDGADARYVARVLRLREGDELVLFDGRGREASARLVAVAAEGGRVELAASAPLTVAREADRLPLTLVVGLLKGEKMDLVVQKATELGVSRLVPVQAARSVVRLEGDRAEGRVARWQKIAREAARQCGRADEPEIAAVVGLDEALRELAGSQAWKVLFYEGAEGEPAAPPLRQLLPAVAAPPGPVVAAVGPEGGFEAAEVEAARQAGFAVAGLGPRVLRAETAAMTACVVLGYALGDLG